MMRSAGIRLQVGLAALACVTGLAACGGSTPSAKSGQSAQTSPPPGRGDTAICQLVTQASAAYSAKNYETWRYDMIEIGNEADSAQYVPVKQYAEDVKKATATTSSATTTKPKSKSKKAEVVGVGGLFDALGGFVGLQHTCAKLPS